MTSYGTPLYFPQKVVSADVFMELITRMMDAVPLIPRKRNMNKADDIDELENDLETDDDMEDEEEEELMGDEEEENEEEDDGEL